MALDVDDHSRPGRHHVRAHLRAARIPALSGDEGKKAIAEKVLLEVVGDRNASATVEQTPRARRRDAAKVSDLRGKTFGLKSVVWVGIGVALFQQVSGANVIMFYDSSLWKAVGFTESASMTIAVVRALLATAVTVLGMLIIDKVGRRACSRSGP